MRRVRPSLGRLGRTKDTHHFKGIVNAGIVSWIAGSATASTLAQIGGVYMFKFSDLPIFENMQPCFEFVRINKCVMEFMPRYNMNTMTNTILQASDVITQPVNYLTADAKSVQLPTFITAHDEVPLVQDVPGGQVVSGTWSSQGGDDSGVDEMKAYGCQGGVTPSYIRGIVGSKETEIYKKHVVVFTPAFYALIFTESTNNNGGVFQRVTKKWLNCSYQFQGQSDGTGIPTSSDTPSLGPDFFGPVYSFSQPGTNTGGTAVLQVYDVKMKYSISFRRVRGY